MFVIDLPDVGEGRRQIRRRGFPTKRAAQEALEAHKTQVANGLYVEPTTLTLTAFINDHWLPSMATRARPTTVDTYRRLARLHIVPILGGIRMQRLERAQVARWVGQLAASGLSPKTVRNVHGVLSKALADAMDLELVSRNVASRTRGLPSPSAAAPRAWSGEQLTQFIRATESGRLGPLWRFIAMTGCRRGEALGLRWIDVDLDAATATITNQRTIAGGTVVEGAPKTSAGARTIVLDTRTVQILKTWKAAQDEERLKMGAGWQGTGLVFTNPDGGGLWPQRVTADFRRIATSLGLPTIGVHGLRHSAATWLISSGVNPRVVQQRLGHAHVAVTLSLYTHVMPAHDQQAAEALAAAVSGAVVTTA